MSTKADCQAACTTAEAALVTQQAKLADVVKQEDERKSNGPDSREYAVTAISAANATLATAIAAVRTQVDALP